MKKYIIALLLIGFITTSRLNVNSQEEGLQVYSFNQFSEGLDVDTATNLTFASSDLQNAVLDETSALTMRTGIVLAYQLPVATTTLLYNSFSAVYDDGSSEFFVHAGTYVYMTTGGNTWTRITNGISSKYIMQFAMFNGEVWMTNGVDNVGVWDRTTYTTYSYIPKGRYIITDKEQVLLAGMFDDPSSVRFSRLFVSGGVYSTAKLEADWPSANQLPCGIGDGQIITGLFKMKNKVYASKEKSIYGLLTDDEYTVAAVIAYNPLYGSVSQRSISDYKDFKIMLDKSGLVGYGGGMEAEVISKNLDNLISKIGIINTNYGRISINSNTDFSTGTYTNAYNNTGTVEISTVTKLWTTVTDFSPAYTGSTQFMIVNNNGGEVQLSTAPGYSRDAKLSYTHITSNGFNVNQIQDGNLRTGWTGINDNDDRTYSWVGAQANQIGYNVLINFWTDTSQTSTMHIKRVRIKYKVTWISGLDHTTAKAFTRRQILGKNADSVNCWLFEEDMVGGLSKEGYTYDLTYEVPDNFYDSSLWGYPVRVQWLMTVARGFDMYIYDVSFYTKGGATVTPNYLSTASYISPIFDSGQNSTQYQSITPSHRTELASSTGSIKYFARSDDNSDMSSPTSWDPLDIFVYGSTFTYSKISTALDNKQYFQLKADPIFTSTVTFTPIIKEITLHYATTDYATYVTKVLPISNKITSWGSFLADDEGTVTYQIRGSTWLPTGGETTLAGSESSQWTAITSGSDIALSTSNVYIQLKAILNSKYAKVEGLSALWFESGTGTGGKQDTPAINYKDRYYMAYSTWSDHNTDVLIFDKNGKYTKYDWDVSGFAQFNNKFYILSSTMPYIYQALTGTTDAGSPISLSWRSPDLDFGYSDIAKEYSNIFLTGKKQSNSFVFIDTYIDFSTTKTDTRYWDLSINSNYQLNLSSQTYGKNIAIVIRSTAPTCEVQLNKYYWKGKPLGH